MLVCELSMYTAYHQHDRNNPTTYQPHVHKTCKSSKLYNYDETTVERHKIWDYDVMDDSYYNVRTVSVSSL